MTATVGEPVEVEVPAAVTKLGLLDRVDYADAFEIRTDLARTPEQWMRALLEGAPRWFTLPWTYLLGGALLGVDPRVVRLPERVMGWTVLHDDPSTFAVGFDSPRGLSARLVVVTSPGTAVTASQMRFDSGYARALWRGGIRSSHRFFLPFLLGRAARQA
jgi:hypothetical protein